VCSCKAYRTSAWHDTWRLIELLRKRAARRTVDFTLRGLVTELAKRGSREPQIRSSKSSFRQKNTGGSVAFQGNSLSPLG
jgi:hypothetical protein